MAAIDEDLRQAVADAFEMAANPVTYTPVDGSPTEIPAIVSYGEDLDDDRFGLAVQANATIHVLESDVPNPSYQDAVEINGDSWTVIKKLGRVAGKWKLEIRRDLRPTFTRR